MLSVAKEVAAGAAVARMACLFGRMNGTIRRVALCASYDVAPLQESGLYEEVIGYREDDMVAALRRVKDLGGGMVLVHEGKVLAEIPLPIGGLMSAGSLEDVATQMEAMKTILREMGCPLEDPVFTLGFLSFSALPWIRLTPSGLLDVKNREILWR